MSSPIKAIPTDEQDQHETFANQSSPHPISRSKHYAKPPAEPSALSRYDGLRTVLLIMFLIVCVCLMTVRYMELREKQTTSQISFEQAQVLSQQMEHYSGIGQIDGKMNQHQSITVQESSLHSNENINSQGQGQISQEQQGLSGHQKLSVSQDLEASDQSSPEHKPEFSDLLVDMGETGTSQVDSDEGQLDGQVDDSSNQELNGNGAKSIEEAELLNNKDLEKVDQLHNFANGQFELHPKAKIFKEPQESLDGQIQQKDFVNSNPQNQAQQKDNQHNIGQENNEIGQQAKNLHDNTQQQPARAPLQLSEQDLYDPIIRVKDKMEENFKTKFQDLIYIKAGTNITEQQYYKARERMSIWKYFNPSTGNLQLIDQVAYEPSVALTPLSIEASIEKVKRTIKEEQQQYEKKYQVSKYQEIPFCIIIPSYKNQDKYLRNLNSILQQDYQNYHIIYIDDASQDGTAEKVKAYIQKYNISEKRLNFIENPTNKKALPNIDYAARRLCQSGEIMAIIDGDDYLIGTQVFKVINARYQEENLLALYTNHLRVHQPIYLKVGTCIDYPQRVKKGRTYRRFSIFPASHLRTFYVDLYWRINIRDLKDYRGQYFTAANDFAIMMPILEMAGDKFQYLPQLTYVYDAGTGFNNFQTKADTQAKNFKITKRRHRYPKLVHTLDLEKRYYDKSGSVFEMSELELEGEKAPGVKLREIIEKMV